MVLEMLKEEKSVTQIASEHGVHPSQLYRWKELALSQFSQLFEDEPQQIRKQLSADERENEQLYAEIGRLTTQLSWLKKKAGQQPAAEGASSHD
jgi:transposase-like protein